MEDMERYGDYNEIDESPTKRKNIPVFIIKMMALIAIAAVITFLGFRIVLFNYYPDSAKSLYFTEKITEYYNETGGSIGAVTQKLRAPYDDADKGNFFCDNLIVVKDVGELQLSVRFNVSVIANIEKVLGLEGLSADDPELLSFRLYRNGESDVEADHLIGALAAPPITEGLLMYRYYKLCFTDVDFGEDEDKIEWIRLEIFIKGQESAKPFAMIPIYEDNAEYSSFTEYKLSSAEAP